MTTGQQPFKVALLFRGQLKRSETAGFAGRLVVPYIQLCTAGFWTANQYFFLIMLLCGRTQFGYLWLFEQCGTISSHHSSTGI